MIPNLITTMQCSRCLGFQYTTACGSDFVYSLVAKARDPLWEESWGSEKMQRKTSL